MMTDDRFATEEERLRYGHEIPMGEMTGGRDGIAEALLQQPAQESVAPLYAMQRPRGSGIAPGADVNSFPVMASTFQAGAGTEDFDRMYAKASGGGQGGDNDRMKQLMMLMGGG